MAGKHIAFTIESMDGHINPTLELARALVGDGFRVSYAVAERIAPRVREVGASALLYSPLNYREFVTESRESVQEGSNKRRVRTGRSWKEFVAADTAFALPQIRDLYGRDRPDMVIYDLRCLAGRILAREWGIPKIEHSPITIGGRDKDFLEHTYDEDLVIVSVPRFFQREPERLDKRFQFVGSMFRKDQVRVRGSGVKDEAGIILVSGPTAGEPELERFELAAEAFKSSTRRVVLSIGERLDPKLLPPLPVGFEVNRFTKQLDMLQSAALFVSHAGQISVLEAMYLGVPILALPSSNLMYESIADRVSELGVGLCLRQRDISAVRVREYAEKLLKDETIKQKVMEYQQLMVAGADLSRAVELIRKQMSERR